MKRIVISLPFAVFCIMFSLAPVFGQTKTVWEIGKFNQSFREFKAGPSDHVVYQVDKNNWVQDWPNHEQPGVVYEIRFNLDAAPQGTFSLKVSLLTRYLNPDLQIEINGHKGLYYVRTQPLYTGDSVTWDVMTIELPTEYMTKGANSLIYRRSNPKLSAATRPCPRGRCFMTLSA